MGDEKSTVLLALAQCWKHATPFYTSKLRNQSCVKWAVMQHKKPKYHFNTIWLLQPEIQMGQLKRKTDPREDFECP